MSFVLKMAWREIRSSWTRLVFFFLCVAVGVAAIVAVRSVIQQVRTTLTGEARALVGADLVLQSGRAWPDDLDARIGAALDTEGVTVRLDVIETATMAAVPQGRATLVELRAIPDRFPLYGTFELGSGRVYDHTLLQDKGLIVQPEFLLQLGINVGDTVLLAGQPFVVRDTVTKDRVQGRGGFAFGPRVYLDIADLRATTILQFGSRATYQRYVQVPDEDPEPASQRLRREFRRDMVSVRSWRSLEDRLGRNLTLAENYLSLVGFAMVVLGGIGVWSVTRVFIQQKIRSVAVLKCVGASSRTILSTYVLQTVVLALAGGVGGVALAAAAIAAVPADVTALAGVTDLSVTWSAALQGMAVGALVSMLFALMPLLEVRDVKPLLLLRADTATTARRRGWRSAATAAAIGAALIGVAVWQADALEPGLYVSLGLAVVAGALTLASSVLLRLVAPLAASRRFPLRHAVVSLRRPGNQTRVILTAVGIGCFFILGIRSLQTNLLTEFAIDLGESTPDVVLIDIQREQVDGVRQVVAPYQKGEPPLLPLMRGRVVGVDGARLQLDGPEDVRREGELAREYGLTYRDALADNERLVDGTFWSGPSSPDAPLEVSIESRIREEHGIGLGDRMRFDIAGRVVEATVTSVREVEWDQTQNGGFIFVFRPGGIIERAPHAYVGFVQLADADRDRPNLQRDLVAAFPNVSVIDVSAVLDSVREVVNAVTMAITIVGVVTIGAGLLILVGAVAMTKFQRLYDAAIYRTLGASTRRLLTMAAIEYGLLGALAGMLGAAGALGLSWAVATRLFDIDWRPDWLGLSVGVCATAAVVALVGVLASADVMTRKPLGTLRGA
ncbi:MAG: ABC transporter permease [Vicinamibacterales bacterium]